MPTRDSVVCSFHSLLQNGLMQHRRLTTRPTFILPPLQPARLYSSTELRQRAVLLPLVQNDFQNVLLRRQRPRPYLFLPLLYTRHSSDKRPNNGRRDRYLDRAEKSGRRDIEKMRKTIEDFRHLANIQLSKPSRFAQWSGHQLSRLVEWQEEKAEKWTEELDEAAGKIERFGKVDGGKTGSTKDSRAREGQIWGVRQVLAIITATGVSLYALETLLKRTSREFRMADPQSFREFELIGKEPVSSTSSVFSLRIAENPYEDSINQTYEHVYHNITQALGFGRRPMEDTIDPYAQSWIDGIWSVEFKQPEMQIARAYTPLPPSLSPPLKPIDPSQLRFLIRREPEGEVSGYLSGLSTGAKIEVRGPNVELRIPDEVREVVFLAGGTGIAPALQTAYSLFEARHSADRPSPRLRILWANRRREDCTGPVVELLERLQAKYEGKIDVRYYVDDERTFIERKDLAAVLGSQGSAGTDHRHVAQESDNHDIAPVGEKLVLVSGPEGFINYLAGPKTWWKGKQKQGPLGGLLATLDCQEKGWSIWKL